MQACRRDDFLAADKRFHLALSEITGNPVYNYVFHSIHDNIHRYYDSYLSMDGRELSENHQDLCDILRAVANRRPDEARVMAQSHVHRFHRYMEARQARENATDPKDKR
jgi:DNA-binding FadR family transcriptional regulator